MYDIVLFTILQNLVETKSVLGSQELLTNAYGLIAVSTYMLYMLHIHVP